FRSFFVTACATLPAADFDGITSPPGCNGPEGGTLRTGNIQVRSAVASDVQSATTGAGAGILPAGASVNGIQLSDGIFGVGVLISSDGSASGDLHAILTGADLLGLPASVTVNGWITAGRANADGSVTLSGTADGVPLTAVA